jgi:lipid-A-disaccharide synthase
MRVLVSALEHSANIHLKALKNELGDEVELVGIFDKSLGNPMVDLSSTAIMGFVDAIKKIRYFYHLLDAMVDLAKDVDKVLLIDSSAFNLPLAKRIKKRYPNKQIIYYILPQAWAWKKWRIKTIERTIDTLASILPFEKEYYAKTTNIHFVGHPLLDEIKQRKSALSDAKKIAFLPGSRRGEIQALLPIYKEVAKNFDGYSKILVIPQNFSQEKIKEYYGDIEEFELSYDTHQTLYESAFAFICSGTATLESALIGTPFVLCYKAKKLDYFIAKMFVKIKYIGLANILFEKMGGGMIHPELLQEMVNAQNLISEYKKMDKALFMQNAQKLSSYLQGGSSKNVACMINYA